MQTKRARGLRHGWGGVRSRSRSDPEYAEVSALTDSHDLRLCIQCGACSAACPLSTYMDYSPRRVMAMLAAGLEDDVLRSRSIWMCASCYACTVACPREIPVTDVMHALKRTAIRQGLHPRRFGTVVLAREFVREVDRWGRNTESRLATRLYLRTRPTLLLKDAGLGRRLMWRGRMSLRRESIRQRKQLRTMLRAAERSGSRSPASASSEAREATGAISAVEGAS